MVLLSNTTEQVLQPGQSITFDRLVAWSGNGECARSGGPIGLRFPNATYKIFFKGLVTGATAGAPVQLSVTLGGSALPETNVVYTPAVAGAVGTVPAETYVRTCQTLSNNISVTNTGTNPITVEPNSAISVIRTA